MDNDKTQLNEKKIISGYNSALKLHLTLKDRSFRNGYVQSVTPDFFTFFDDLNGKEPIFFLELYNVEPCMEREI